MRYSFWMAMSLSLVLVLSACGGDGGGGTPGGETGGETPGGGSSNLSVEVADDVSWAAFQDGEEAWTSLTVGEVAELNVTDAAGAFGLAHVCVEEGGRKLVTLFYATLESYESAPQEDFAGTLECEFLDPVPAPPPYLTLSGTVAGVEGGEGGSVSFGFANDIFYNEPDDAKLSYTLDTVLAGTADLVATNGSVDLSTPDEPPTRGIIRRDVTVDGDATVDLDFVTEGVALDTHQVEVTNLDALDDSFSGTAALLSEGGTTHAGLADANPVQEISGSSLSFDYASFPATSGDRYAVSATVLPEGDETGCTRTSSRTLATPQDVSIALPGCFIIDVDVTDTDPYIRPIATVRDRVDVATATRGGYSYGQLESLLDININFFGNERVGAFTTYQLPDLSDTEGWSSDWELTAGETVRYIATFSFEDAPAEQDSVSVRGTVTPSF